MTGPIVVVGAHVQGLVLDVEAVPQEGQSVLGWGFEEPLDGGKSSNQAVAAARLGAPTVLVSVVGSDERGRRAIEYFTEQGIDVRFCEAVDGPTDVGFVLLPPSRIPAIATALERNRQLTAATVARAGDVIAQSSCVVCALEAEQDVAIAAFELARAAGVRTILNPAPPAQLEPRLLELTDLLVPNEHEAASLAGSSGPPGELATELARRFGLEVAVTAGETGVHVAAGEGPSMHVPAPEVTAVDTTGAGDAFVGALAVRLRDSDSLLDAARFAVRAASLSVQRPGTMPSFPTLAEL